MASLRVSPFDFAVLRTKSSRTRSISVCTTFFATPIGIRHSHSILICIHYMQSLDVDAPLLVARTRSLAEVAQELPGRPALRDPGEVPIRGNEPRESEGPRRRDGPRILHTDVRYEVPGGAEVRLQHEIARQEDEISERRGEVLAVVPAEVLHDFSDDPVRDDSTDFVLRQQFKNPMGVGPSPLEPEDEDV